MINLAEIISSLEDERWIFNAEAHYDEDGEYDGVMMFYPLIDVFNSHYCPIAWALRQAGIKDDALRTMSEQTAMSLIRKYYKINLHTLERIGILNSDEKSVQQAKDDIHTFLTKK